MFTNRKWMYTTLNYPLSRRHDLDWLRVIAFGLLIVYHAGLFFNHWSWHIKNNELSYFIEPSMLFSGQWRMSLLFMISGAAVFFALRKRNGVVFLRERILRLFLPLLFGMLVVVPPQIYLERLTQGATYSYFDFLKLVFEFKRYPQGNFGWHHLWYLAYVFAYSVVGLPLFLVIKRYGRLTQYLTRLSVYPVLFIGIPVFWLWSGQWVFNTYFPAPDGHINDLNKHFHYFTMFTAGFILCTQPAFWTSLLGIRRISLSITLVLTVVQYFYYWKPDYPPTGLELEIQPLIVALSVWCVLLTIFGYAYRYLNFSNEFLARSNEAVYPFYIMHQTVLVCLAFPLINSVFPIGAKFAYLVAATFLVCWALYESLIIRSNVLRFLFGMKPREKAGKIKTKGSPDRKVAILSQK